jgi:hypothetical protein
MQTQNGSKPDNVEVRQFSREMESIIAMRFVEAFRPAWLRVALPLFPAYILGWIIGPFL